MAVGLGTRSRARALIAAFTVAVAGACGEDPAATDDAGDVDPPDSQTPDIRPDSSDAADAVEDDGTLCEPGSHVCATALSYLVCGEDGSTRTQVQCEDGLGCLEGECVEQICEAFEVRTCFNETALETCNFSGTAWVQEDCPAFWTCEESRCVEPPCIPESTRCSGLDHILTCDPSTGEYVETTTCASGTACYEEECQPLCEINRKLKSYVGCEYWTVDLDNYDTAEVMEHTVVLANPSTEVDATIEIVDADGIEMELQDSTVPAGGQLVIRFPSDRGLIRPGITDFSWQITSSIPVTAHQFNPLDNFLDPFTNDGTLLLPVHALGERYWALSWIHRDVEVEPLNGFISIIAVEDDGAELTVRTSADALVGDGATPMTPGETRNFHLDRGQTLTLQTAGTGDDLTGSYIESEDTQIVVFGGHECGNVVLGIDRCDHMEAQLLPIELLRNSYVAAKYMPRVTDPEVRVEPDYYRILAVEGATELHTNPEIPGVDGAILGTGEWMELGYNADFELTADRPISVAHYMVGSNYTGIPRNCFDDTGPPTGIGDPAMQIIVPIEQWRQDYIVLTPFAYVQDYLNLTVPSGVLQSVRLDGESVASELFTPIADGVYSVARLLVQDGPHTVIADEPFGLDAYGYSCHVSYAYPGGLNLEEIEEN